MRDLNIALVQTQLHWHDPEANRAHFSTQLAAIDRADLIILPEMFTTGFTMASDTQAEPANSTTLKWLQSMAIEKQAVITGSLSTKSGDHYVNRLYWVRPDGSHTSYDKRHLFAMAGEHHSYRQGQQRLIVDLHDWRVCPFICYDLRFPVWSRNRNDYDLLIYVANWPDKRRQHWIKLLQARAIENQSWCIGVNRIGEDDNGLKYAGDSMVCDPLGEVIADAGNRDAVVELSLSATHLNKVRQQLPFLDDADDFQLIDKPDSPVQSQT